MIKLLKKQYCIFLVLILILSFFVGCAKEEHATKNNSLLCDFNIAGEPVSSFSLSCDKGFEEMGSDIKDLIFDKFGIELSSGDSKGKIRLTSKGAVKGEISAKIEGKDLVIRATEKEEMKKAVVCFWFENIAYSTEKLNLSNTFNYKRDLTKTVFYSDFDVKQSSDECCIDEMIEAHDYANQNGYKVFADYKANYYISSTDKTVIVNTDVEWGNSKIVIDDTDVSAENRGNWIFEIASNYSEYNIWSIKTAGRNTSSFDVILPQKSMVTIYNDNKKNFIRYGENANSGQTMQDSVVVETNGSISADTPITWDFENVSRAVIRPIDETKLTVSGGEFITKANSAPSEYTYYARGINITRSNTVVNGITHRITDEGENGAPYMAFLNVNNCAYFTAKNCVFTGHKTYKSSTSQIGSYDIGFRNTVSATLINCSQTNDITDATWGIAISEFSKNLVYDSCTLSRFDAHQGVTNATIKNSVIGSDGINVVGYGTLLIENTTVLSDSLVRLREDYGSSWEGDVIIRNCTINSTSYGMVTIFSGENLGDHDFGYVCHSPKNVKIDGLKIENATEAYIFSNINPIADEEYIPQYPYIETKKVELKNYSSPVDIELCLNPNLFLNTEFDFE